MVRCRVGLVLSCPTGDMVDIFRSVRSVETSFESISTKKQVFQKAVRTARSPMFRQVFVDSFISSLR